MKVKKSVVIRYSEAFKHQVVKEVEEDHCSCAQAQKKYATARGGSYFRPSVEIY